MKSKLCNGCYINNPIIEFSKHKNMADGYENKCKGCRLKRNKELYAQNRVTWLCQSHHKFIHQKIKYIDKRVF